MPRWTKVIRMPNGTPMRCKVADSTFDPSKEATDYTWAVQWCVAITETEFQAERSQAEPAG